MRPAVIQETYKLTTQVSVIFQFQMNNFCHKIMKQLLCQSRKLQAAETQSTAGLTQFDF